MLKIDTDISELLEQATELLNKCVEIDTKLDALKDKVTFLTVQDVIKLTNWSKPTVLELFRRPDFPACDLGQAQVVFAPAFCEFFMKRVQRSDFKR